jgi:aspartyl-tRNA(Asn)/glutamyl-tRNA(Gln) amidotransferase subunit A
MTPTITQAAAAIREKKLTCTSLLQQCLDRIGKHEAAVRAWVLVASEEALEEARERDAELARGLDRGLLHGIPVGIKDIIDVFDWPTACGSRRWKEAHARHDAPAVQRLRDAGAVILGKTVTTQYASYDPPPTRNPWSFSRTPGGSSSGSAAAVAAGMCLAALGTQTGGSITRPASYCGTAAVKPSYLRVSTQGLLPLAHSMDHVGVLARTVTDTAIVLQAISDPPVDNWLAAMSGEIEAPVLGRPRGYFEQHASRPVLEMMDRACQRLAEAGARIEEVALPASFANVVSLHRRVMAVEAAQYHQRRFRRHPEDYDPCFSALLWEGIECSAPEYARAKEHQARLTEEMHEVLESIDALICPAATGPAPSAETTGDPAFNVPWSFTGLPAVSFPVELADGLPVAVQLVGGPFEERAVFAAAAWCEEALAPSLGEPSELHRKG